MLKGTSVGQIKPHSASKTLTKVIIIHCFRVNHRTVCYIKVLYRLMKIV